MPKEDGDSSLNKPLTFYLASASPRRHRLIKQIWAEARICPSGVEEEATPGLSAGEQAQTWAGLKAESVSQKVSSGLVLGCDTIVVIEGRILGKPGSAREAESMLQVLRGQGHHVMTALTLIQVPEGQRRDAIEISEVWMRSYDDLEISKYVATGEPLDKAGSYAIQGKGARLVADYSGCFNNIVGLPLCRVAQAIAHFGFADFLQEHSPCRLPDGSPCPVW